MKRLTLRTENQWRSLKDGAGVDLLRASFHANRFLWAGAVTVAGFGFGFTYWHVKLPEWKPIEIEPEPGTQAYTVKWVRTGMEHAP
jgi:hypothetical protein